ncbi:MAG: hypothetical protein PWP07_2575 [Epulopiscium sp.]|jgi:hypothetical protein|uniref:hypothetical protein n=1 Tax=Defluviitalea raffinosedens TaxID=1450156 RepID=UPI001A9BDE8A|nr:hypothetical protein [Defluviitalea raffinosedens]MBM7686340.1 hypothetical protein [Defluviitalea raffinosedens]MBZ4667147.1 hypothetical protein [Defluviitaleaceae bacterium]MDK2789330.1 hypothetical protein [Candidatus Epulonipiscium sp.]
MILLFFAYALSTQFEQGQEYSCPNVCFEGCSGCFSVKNDKKVTFSLKMSFKSIEPEQWMIYNRIILSVVLGFLQIVSLRM